MKKYFKKLLEDSFQAIDELADEVATTIDDKLYKKSERPKRPKHPKRPKRPLYAVEVIDLNNL